MHPPDVYLCPQGHDTEKVIIQGDDVWCDICQKWFPLKVAVCEIRLKAGDVLP